MSFPYPPPDPIKTTKRCQFSLPGKHYDCRRIGKYVLDSKRYCACHYDTAWKVANPELGQTHEWHLRRNHITGVVYPYQTCKRCGYIRQHEGLPQGPCDGKMPQITLRGVA